MTRISHPPDGFLNNDFYSQEYQDESAHDGKACIALLFGSFRPDTFISPLRLKNRVKISASIGVATLTVFLQPGTYGNLVVSLYCIPD